MTLLDALRATGLTVHAVPHWATNGDHWPVGAPFGIMHHHTTAPIPYPVSWLDGTGGGLVKCNVNIKQDGTIWLVNGRTCNYASGPGSAVVLSETKRNIAPVANARERRLKDDTNGNRYYFNIENDHAGLGGPLSKTQRQAILAVTQALLDFYGLKPNQVVSHAEWTARKVDPYWDGSTRTVEAIRLDLEEPMTPEQKAALDLLVAADLKAYNYDHLKAIHSAAAKVNADVENFFTRLFGWTRARNFPGSGSGGTSETRVRELIEGSRIETGD